MKKSDKSIRNITLANVKRSLMADAVCNLTMTYETEEMSEVPFAENAISEELPIASTYVDKNNYTLITTRRIITNRDSSKYEVLFQNIRTYKFGDFKGMTDNPVTLGGVTSINDENIPVLIESGKASMIVINAIRTISNVTTEITI